MANYLRNNRCSICNGKSRKDEGNFHKKTCERSKYKRQAPTMDKFMKFWAGIWEDEVETT